jgi:hypothetical protein
MLNFVPSDFDIPTDWESCEGEKFGDSEELPKITKPVPADSRISQEAKVVPINLIGPRCNSAMQHP